MKIDRIQTKPYRVQTFGYNSPAIQLKHSTINVGIEQTVNNKTLSMLGKLFAKITNKFSRTKQLAVDTTKTAVAKETATTIAQKTPNLFTKESYINKLTQQGKKEGTDYKVFDFPHYKAIEEYDTEANINRIIRFRENNTISLIAEYKATTQSRIGVKKYDELGNLIA